MMASTANLYLLSTTVAFGCTVDPFVSLGRLVLPAHVVLPPIAFQELTSGIFPNLATPIGQEEFPPAWCRQCRVGYSISTVVLFSRVSRLQKVLNMPRNGRTGRLEEVGDLYHW